MDRLLKLLNLVLFRDLLNWKLALSMQVNQEGYELFRDRSLARH